MKKEQHTTLFPRSTLIVFVIPSLLRRRKKGITFYYFVYTHTYTRSSLFFCFLDFFFHRLYRRLSIIKSVFSRRFFFGPFFGGLFLGAFFYTHASYLSLFSSVGVCWCCACITSFGARERERKKRPRENRSGLVDDTVRRSLSSSFLKALGSSAWSLEISSKFFAFPISIRGNHLIGKKKTQTYNNDPKERAFLVHAPPPSNTAKSGVVGSLLSKRGHHHHQRS